MTDVFQPLAVDAARALDSALTQLGLGLNGPAREAAATELAQALRVDRASSRPFLVDANGTPRVVVRDGRAEEMNILDAVRELAERHGAAKAPAAPASSSTFENLTERMIQRRAQETGDLRRQAEALGKGPNPWAPNSPNLTARMTITRHAPELAERLKKEAGQ